MKNSNTSNQKQVMKTKIIFLILIIIILNFSSGIAQNPTYNLTVRNMTLTSGDFPDNQLEFDIYIENTNGNITNFEYAGGQYFFSFNRNILSSGTFPPVGVQDTALYRYHIIGSDLPTGMIPRSPTFGTATNPTANVLRLAVNSFPGAGNGYNMTNNGFPGTKIVRMRITNKQGPFNEEYFNLAWRNPPVISFTTKIFAYVGNINTDITTPQTHFIDSSGLGIVLPVELAGFTSKVNKNNVTLNWTTTNEINNLGFAIERSNINGQWTKTGFIAGYEESEIPHDYLFVDKGLNSGKYHYRLKQIDLNGNFKYYNLENEVEVGIPAEFNLSQNYPNPFNPVTKIDYDLPYDGKVSLILNDITGRELATIVNESKTAGYYTIQFNASDLSSGVYFYRISVQGSRSFVSTKKMVLIK